jgi:hypothetical protein
MHSDQFFLMASPTLLRVRRLKLHCVPISLLKAAFRPGQQLG